MKFKNENFNELYEFMEKMDKSDDYLMILVSAVDTGKGDMKVLTLGTYRTGGKPVINKAKAEAVLIKAMEKSDDFKRLFTNAVMLYESLQVFERSQQ